MEEQSMSSLSSTNSPTAEARKTVDQVFQHHGDSFYNPFVSWRKTSFDPSSSLLEPNQRPQWCYPILMRVWDYTSRAKLDLRSEAHTRGFKVDHKPPPPGLGRNNAFKCHLDRIGYDVCFISTTSSFQGVKLRVQTLYNRIDRVKDEPVFITFIDASVLSLVPWLLLFVPEEVRKWDSSLDDRGLCYANYDDWKEEVLAIREILEEAILHTVVAPNLVEKPLPA